ncbi:MAG: M28 family metallopeptidase [Bacteroidetes bacterium]|nr:M28 family metallopeptidase [Bacteroidota bacterium]
MMKLAVCDQELRAALASPDRRAELDVSWVQFGDQLFLLTSDEHWDNLQRRADETGAHLRAISHAENLGDLYLIRQKGRLFQREHPDIAVLFDRGRYLVAQISDEARKRIMPKVVPCYQVLPLQPNTVVFEKIPRPAVRAAADPWVKQFVDLIGENGFRQRINQLANYHTRHSLSSDYASVIRSCRDQLEAMNYRTHLQEVTIGSKSSHNLIADKAGAGSLEQQQIVVIAAHLDSINWIAHGSPDAPAPGADDNGSGSAGLLEIAGALQNHAFTQSLRFVLFCGEEEGLYGSQQYVQAMFQSERARMKAVVNMDMIGGLNTHTPSVTLESSDKYSEMIDVLVNAGHVYTSLEIETSWHYFDSDHVPFIDAGIPAVLTIEGADTSNHYIHSPDDILAHVNYSLALEVLRMNTAFIAINAR